MRALHTAVRGRARETVPGLHAFRCRAHTHSLLSAHSLVVHEGTKGHWQRQLPHTLVADETPRPYDR